MAIATAARYLDMELLADEHPQEIVVGDDIYGRPACQLRHETYHVIARHAARVPDSATFQTLLWDNVTVWKTELGEFIDWRD